MSHIVIQDPNDLSTRFSNQDRLGYDGSGFDFDFDVQFDSLIERNLGPVPQEDLLQEGPRLDFSSIAKFLHRIPGRESDIITLYYRDRMKQEQIASIFEITQAAVSYRLHRGIKRIQFLQTIPELDEEEFYLDLEPKFEDQDLQILWRMNITTCQSAIAKDMGLTQGRVRHRFFRSLARIKDLIIEEIKEKESELKHQFQKIQKKYPDDNRSSDEETRKEEDKYGLRGRYLKDFKESYYEAAEEVINTSKYGKYWTVYYAISDRHFNILHEVTLPQFKNRGDARIIPLRDVILEEVPDYDNMDCLSPMAS